MRLIFVHGRGQHKKSSASLQVQWEAAWEVGLRNAGLVQPKGFEIVFPFYGDMLDDLIRRIESPLLVDIITRGEKHSETSRLQAGMLLEMTITMGISDRSIQEELPPGEAQHRGIENSAWLRAVARLLDRTPFGFSTIDNFTHDVAVYLTNLGVRSRIDKIVESVLNDQPSVVVAHSLGTVIAYNVLTNCSVPTAIYNFVTLGSPLGYTAVRNRIELPVAMPGCVIDWFNARDPTDIVAGIPLDKSTFDILPPIEEKADIQNTTDNHHGIEGYLTDPVVASRIYRALKAT
jgi:hypothetical protein